MITYWTNLNERERWIVGIGTSCAVLWFLYLLIYSPLTSAVDEKSKRLIEKKETLAWMQQVSQQNKPTKALQIISNSKLPTLIATQLRTTDFQKFPFQLEQTVQGDVQLSFETIPYTLILTWLWKLNTDYAISLKQFTVDRSGTPGIVKIMIILHSVEP